MFNKGLSRGESVPVLCVYIMSFTDINDIHELYIIVKYTTFFIAISI